MSERCITTSSTAPATLRRELQLQQILAERSQTPPHQIIHIRLGFSILEVQRLEGDHIELSPPELADGDTQIPPPVLVYAN